MAYGCISFVFMTTKDNVAYHVVDVTNSQYQYADGYYYLQ